jgi:hypothetical protein
MPCPGPTPLAPPTEIWPWPPHHNQSTTPWHTTDIMLRLNTTATSSHVHNRKSHKYVDTHCNTWRTTNLYVHRIPTSSTLESLGTVGLFYSILSTRNSLSVWITKAWS